MHWADMSLVQRLLCVPSWFFLTLLSTLRLITSIPTIHKWAFENCLAYDISLGDSRFYNYLHKNRLFWFTQIVLELFLSVIPITVMLYINNVELEGDDTAADQFAVIVACIIMVRDLLIILGTFATGFLIRPMDEEERQASLRKSQALVADSLVTN